MIKLCKNTFLCFIVQFMAHKDELIVKIKCIKINTRFRLSLTIYVRGECEKMQMKVVCVFSCTVVYII